MYSASTFSASLSASVQYSVSIPTFLAYLITRLVTIMTKNNTAKVWYSHDRMTITARSGDCIHGGQQLQKHKSDNKQGLVTKVCFSSKWILEGEDDELRQSVSCPEGRINTEIHTSRCQTIQLLLERRLEPQEEWNKMKKFRFESSQSQQSNPHRLISNLKLLSPKHSLN